CRAYIPLAPPSSTLLPYTTLFRSDKSRYRRNFSVKRIGVSVPVSYSIIHHCSPIIIIASGLSGIFGAETLPSSSRISNWWYTQLADSLPESHDFTCKPAFIQGHNI